MNASQNIPLSIPVDGHWCTTATTLLAVGRSLHPVGRPTGTGRLCHGHSLLTMILRGENRIFGEGWVQVLRAGDALAIPAGVPFEAQFGQKEALAVINATFQMHGREGLQDGLFLRPVRAADHTEGLRLALEEAATSLRLGDGHLAGAQFAVALLEWAQLLIRRSRVLSRNAQRALEYVRSRQGLGVTRAAIAAHCTLSPTYVSHLVKRETGRSLHEHVSRAVVAYAQELMQTTTLNISEIADRAGLSLYSFSRLFKRVTGVPPSAYLASLGYGRPRR